MHISQAPTVIQIVHHWTKNLPGNVLIYVSAPEVSLRMDHINAGVVQGSIPGTIIGGATLTEGVVGNALKLNGVDQYVEYGTHVDECYHTPDLCTDGVTFSFWVIMHGHGQIFTSGNNPYAVGFFFTYLPGDELFLSALYASAWDNYRIAEWPSNQWRHVVVTWALGDGLTLYLNGCNADPGKSSGFAVTVPRLMRHTRTDQILIGKANSFGSPASMTLDEFFIWHEILSPDHIWQLYVQADIL